jgi:hypothetical protein
MMVGCSKSPEGGPTATATATVVALTGNDIKADGTLSDQGLKALQDQSARPDVTVSFLRSKISDGALVQLASFPNVHRVEAMGSPLTDPAIAKLKAANPNVVVMK